MEIESTNSGTIAKPSPYSNYGGFATHGTVHEHQLTFSQYPDAKSMFAAIETRFGVVWMNKPDVETMSIDDLYNNFKIVEQKVKKTVGTSSGGQNLAFMTAQHYQYHDAEHSESIMFSASPSEVTIKDRQRLFSINAITTVGYDKSKVDVTNCHKPRVTLPGST
ncbi:hypothetical protein Tco_0481249 [Tanacetum coccineum]